MTNEVINLIGYIEDDIMDVNIREIGDQIGNNSLDRWIKAWRGHMLDLLERLETELGVVE